jgi:hypothetical protein
MAYHALRLDHALQCQSAVAINRSGAARSICRKNAFQIRWFRFDGTELRQTVLRIGGDAATVWCLQVAMSSSKREVCFMVYGIGWRACIWMKHLLASIAQVASEEMAAISVALQPPSSG